MFKVKISVGCLVYEHEKFMSFKTRIFKIYFILLYRYVHYIHTVLRTTFDIFLFVKFVLTVKIQVFQPIKVENLPFKISCSTVVLCVLKNCVSAAATTPWTLSLQYFVAY